MCLVLGLPVWNLTWARTEDLNRNGQMNVRLEGTSLLSQEATVGKGFGSGRAVIRPRRKETPPEVEVFIEKRLVGAFPQGPEDKHPHDP